MFFYKKNSGQKYTDCSLKDTYLLYCALIGVCAVIMSNTVYVFVEKSEKRLFLLGNGILFRYLTKKTLHSIALSQSHYFHS